jgi:hypothetical protein
MDYKAKYLKYKAKYLELQNVMQNEQTGQLGQFGGDHHEESSSNAVHVSKKGPSMSKIEEVMRGTTISAPEKPLEMPSADEVAKNDDLKKMEKKKNRSQSRALPIVDIFIIQPNYMDNPSKAIAKFQEGAQFYGRNSFFGQIYSHYINYGMNFINNTVMFSGFNSNIIQEDPINGVFVFQMNNGMLYQVTANNIGITGRVGLDLAIIWAWVQTFFTTNISYANMLDSIMRKINKSPELQQASGITTYSGTSITYAPGIMDPQEWYYMMIVGYLARAQGYFSISSGGDNYTYYLITSLRQL